MKKSLVIGIFLIIFISLIFQISAEVCPQGQECVPEQSNELTQEPPERYSPDVMIAEEIYTFVGNLIVLIGIFIILSIIIIAFIRYSIKNKSNKKKFILSLTSSILLILNSVFFFIIWLPCIDGCDMFGESLVTVFFILPIAGLIIVPWIIYWTINYYKNRRLTKP